MTDIYEEINKLEKEILKITRCIDVEKNVLRKADIGKIKLYNLPYKLYSKISYNKSKQKIKKMQKQLNNLGKQQEKYLLKVSKDIKEIDFTKLKNKALSIKILKYSKEYGRFHALLGYVNKLEVSKQEKVTDKKLVLEFKNKLYKVKDKLNQAEKEKDFTYWHYALITLSDISNKSLSNLEELKKFYPKINNLV